MNILIACNDNYLVPARVCVKSLLENMSSNQINELQIFVMHLESEKRIIPSLKTQYPSLEIYDISVPDCIKNDISIPKKYNTHVTIETYFRLFCIQYLPSDVERFLYMDVDAFCDENFEKIYSIEMDDNYMAGCYDYGLDLRPDVKKEVFSNLDLKENDLYVNGGVLLFNLKKIREDYTQQDVMNYMKKIEEKVVFHDQDILNSLFMGRIFKLPKEMNMRPFHYAHNVINNMYLKRKAYIVHYGQKPWNDKFVDLAPEIFWKYARLLGMEDSYREWKKRNRDYKINNWYTILKARVKRNLNVYKLLKRTGKMNYYQI